MKSHEVTKKRAVNEQVDSTLNYKTIRNTGKATKVIFDDFSSRFAEVEVEFK